MVSDGTNDHLYISLSNSDTDLGWADKPVWTAAPFNATAGGEPVAPPSPLQIANVFLSEATDKEYIVVDAIRNPGQPVGMLSRFYLDVSTPANPIWVPHDLSIDVQAAGYDSCLGRSANAFGIDGLYTKGMVGTSAQLAYMPLLNAFGTTPPPSSPLGLPGGLAADAIAAARNPDNTSDLYVAARGGLYRFASDNQKRYATGVLVASNPLLAAVRSLYADVAGGSVTVWGLNGNDEVFYLACPQGQEGTTAAWSVPLPILTGADAISPYVDHGYHANTFFAHTGTGLYKLVKSPTTGLWAQRRVTLKPDTTTAPATPISSYTTHIRVADTAGQPAAGVAVTLTASNVTSVYINHLYYIIGPSPIQVPTDALGTVTIVELTNTLGGTRFTVTAAAQPALAVNTMDTAWQRNAQYTTTASLKGAKIVNRDGSTRDFVPAGTTDDTLNRVAASNQALAKAYTGLAAAPPPAARAVRKLVAAHPSALAAAGVAEGILVDIGDLFQWIGTGIEAVVRVIEDLAEGVWHFVVSIGKAVYHAVLDCVEAIVAAATWVYNQIKIAVEDVIKFLEFLFGWQDILVTHNVLKNLMLCLGRQVIDDIQTTKAKAAGVFQQLQSELNKWADIPDFPQTAATANAANPPLAQQNSAPSQLGMHHFQGNCASSSSSLSPVGPAEAIFDDLLTLMKSEGQTLSSAADAVKTQIIDKFSSLSLTDIIKKFLAIIGDTILQSAENVVVTLLDVFAKLVEGVMDILTAKLDIPVLSWLYKELTGEDLSFLDVLCLIAAIPVTLIYKVAAGKTPFPKDDAFTKGLLGAGSFADIKELFLVAPRVPSFEPRVRSLMASAEAEEPVLDQAKLKTFGFVTGIAALGGAGVLVVVTNLQRVLDATGTNGIPKTLATIACAANIVYVSPNIATLINAKTDNWYSDFNNAMTGISILKGMCAIPASVVTNPAVGKGFAFVESFINLLWNVPVIANIYYNAGEWNGKYKSLIPESIGNFAFNFGGMLEFPIAIISDAKAKIILAVIQAGLMVGYGGFMIIAGGIYQFAPNQSHYARRLHGPLATAHPASAARWYHFPWHHPPGAR